jgi:glucose/arabinose dehydrogenase
MKKITLLFLAIIIIVFVAVYILQRNNQDQFKTGELNNGINGDTTTIAIAENLYVPWSMAFLATGDMIVAERNGNLKIIDPKTKEIKSNIEVPGVEERGEGGLVGLTMHPEFQDNSYLYIYYTTQSGGTTINKVVRYSFLNDILTNEKIIVDNIPGGINHNGGRMAFGPDGMLYITTGDAGRESLSQDRNSLAGKILRVNDDGSIPSDNPFGNEVYALGLRNPQGLVWDDKGNLWLTDHGRSGLVSGYDEINFIEKGLNYGWPIIQGDETREGMRAPAIHSGPTTTWAPAGIAHHNGKLYFAGLRGSSLYEVRILNSGKLGEPKTNFKDQYGRLRDVLIINNTLYFSTSNRDGRGTVRKGDDKIIKFELQN